VTVAIWVCSEEDCGPRGGESTLALSSDGRAKLTLRGLDELAVWSGSWSGDEWLGPDVRWERVHVFRRRERESDTHETPTESTSREAIHRRARSFWRIVEKRTTNAHALGRPTGDGGMELVLEDQDWPLRHGRATTYRWMLKRITTLPAAAARGHLELP
jgi:hypothetical protein